MITSVLDSVEPLVVVVLFAQRTLAVEDSSAMTMQSSALDSARTRSMVSVMLTDTPSSGALLAGVQDVDAAEQRRRRAVRDRRDLARLALAAVERAAQQI